MKKPLIFGSAVLAALFISGCNKPQESVAIVNGEAITADEFFQHLKIKPQVMVVDANGNIGAANVAETLGFQAMQDLVNYKIIQQLAKDMGVEPTAKDIENEVAFRKKRNPEYVTSLLNRGLTLTDIRNSLRIDLSRENLLTHSIKITDQEVEDAIKKNPQWFIQPELVDSLWIFVKDDRGKRDVDRALQAGGSFETVAVRYSEAPNAKQVGAKFPNRVAEQVPAKEIQDILKKTPPGKESAWIQMSDGWAKFFIQTRTPSKKLEIKDSDKEFIKRQLAQERGRLANDLEKRLRDKLQSAKITINQRELKQPWETAMESLKNQAEEQNRVKSPTDESTPAPGSGPNDQPSGR